MVALGALLLLSAPTPPPPSTRISIDGTRWTINGAVTSPGTPAEGMLVNMRAANALFDDENPETVARWAYPDTGVWDADRNTRELVGNLSAYRAAGIDAITVSLQGGSPVCYGRFGGWRVSAFNEDGSLKPAWLKRLDMVLRAADAVRLVVIVQYFYPPHLIWVKDTRAATAAITAWLLQTGLTNLLVEVFNEACSSDNAAAIERVHAIAAASGRMLPTSTSCIPGVIPSKEVIAASDYLLLHSNGRSPTLIKENLHWVRHQPAYLKTPKPIVINEDDPRFGGDDGYFGNDSALAAAVASNVSWGFMCCCGSTSDGGHSHYEGSIGYQCPPVNWGLRGQCHSDPERGEWHMSKEEWFAAARKLTSA